MSKNPCLFVLPRIYYATQYYWQMHIKSKNQTRGTYRYTHIFLGDEGMFQYCTPSVCFNLRKKSGQESSLVSDACESWLTFKLTHAKWFSHRTKTYNNFKTAIFPPNDCWKMVNFRSSRKIARVKQKAVSRWREESVLKVNGNSGFSWHDWLSRAARAKGQRSHQTYYNSICVLLRITLVLREKR